MSREIPEHLRRRAEEVRRRSKVQPRSSEWVLQRHPHEKVEVTRASLEILQAENALLHKVLDEARLLVLGGQPLGSGASLLGLRTAVAQFDGWVDEPETERALVQKLLEIAEDLDDGTMGA